MSSRVRLFRGREAQEKTGLTNVQDGFERGVKAALFLYRKMQKIFSLSVSAGSRQLV